MIERVEMVNWRAYERRTFEFAPGITFIMGANGSGKTSILEAIAYALTGEPSTVQERASLLRRPDTLAEVRLDFAMGGETYRVERAQSSARAEGARLVSSESGQLLASSHKRSTEQIERI
ncbi:MAG: AAA family ATPase, partial [Candidatus Binatia bacterium]